jgi:protein-L-isoaspartate(D-aspartate) O-methyltransferase
MSMSELVGELERGRWLTSPRVKQALLKIDRADFVPEAARPLAYVNEALSIGHQQTISQPAVVALMLELLNPKPGQKIMDVGAGSGWQTALLAELVGRRGKVYAVEVVPELYEQAKRNLAKYNFSNIELMCKNARGGLPKLAPFDGIIAGASGVAIPAAWKQQLKIGGRIVMPVETDLVVMRKISKRKFAEQAYPGFIFVPLI